MISVADMSCKLFLHQLSMIYWAFKQEHQIGSSFVTDESDIEKVSLLKQFFKAVLISDWYSDINLELLC